MNYIPDNPTLIELDFFFINQRLPLSQILNTFNFLHSPNSKLYLFIIQISNYSILIGGSRVRQLQYNGSYNIVCCFTAMLHLIPERSSVTPFRWFDTLSQLYKNNRGQTEIYRENKTAMTKAFCLDSPVLYTTLNLKGFKGKSCQPWTTLKQKGR